MPHRRLAAIMFADIVGYTAMMGRDEQEAKRCLNKFRDLLREQVAVFRGQIIHFYGDGCLAIFDSPLDAAECAMEVQQEFRQLPVVPVRVGLHSGTVTVDEDNVYGDAINVASRIESLAVPGAVLFSKKLADELKNQPVLQMQGLGSFAFKHVDQPMEIFALANEGFPVPQRSEMKGKLRKEGSKFPFKWLAAALIVLASCIAGIFVFQQKNSGGRMDIVSNAIAVMPFRDMSPKKDQEYFGDGIAEEILNTLAQLKELKVVGRTSSFSFKGKEVTISEIGKALGVDLVLEGSIRKDGNNIRITTKLIKVKDGFHIWSEKYDRPFEEIFKIQEEVAQNIGKIVLEKLNPEQEQKLSINTPVNAKAYELTLKANHINRTFYLGQRENTEAFRLSEKLLLEAIAMDSSYAFPHASLATLYDTHYLVLSDSVQKKHYGSLMIRESEIAYRLNPNDPYVNVARGWSLLSSGDYQAAFQSFRRAYELNPNSSDGLAGLGCEYRELGLIEDAIVFFDKAIEIEPLNAFPYMYKGVALSRIGAYEKANNAFRSVLKINPAYTLALANLADNLAFESRRDEALVIFEEIERTKPEFLESRDYFRLVYAAMKGDKKIAESLPGMSGIYAFLTGDNEAIKKMFFEELNYWKSLEAYPSNSRYLQVLRNPHYQTLKDSSWYIEFLQSEKEKYDRFYAQYPRASEVLVN